MITASHSRHDGIETAMPAASTAGVSNSEADLYEALINDFRRSHSTSHMSAAAIGSAFPPFVFSTWLQTVDERRGVVDAVIWGHRHLPGEPAPPLPSGTSVVFVARVFEAQSRNDFSFDPPPPTAEPGRLIAEIRAALSLHIKEVAEILHVERPTIYSWIKGHSTPQRQNALRLRRVSDVAQYWNTLSRLPVGKAIRQPLQDGKSLVDYLKEDPLPTQIIRTRLQSIALEENSVKPTVRERAEQRGIDPGKVSSQQYQVDVLTGKRISLD